MLLGIHLNIVLREATALVLSEETTVSTIQNIDFRVGELGVMFGVGRAILLSNMTSHDGSTVCRVLAMEN